MEWKYTSQYYVHDNMNSPGQLSDEYCDVTALHSYLTTAKKDGEYIHKFEVMNSIMDCFSDLRAIALEKEEEYDWVHVKSQRDSIPLSLSSVDSYFRSLSDRHEPPLRIIVRIAQDHYSSFSYLVSNLHKVLRRERSFVNIDKVQQLDSQCLVWLIRQPGRTPAEKAGARQKLMSVRRFESVNTLENRVLKECLRLCIINAESYLHDFEKGNEDSPRIEAVRNLRNLCLSAIVSEEFKEISAIYSLPEPNYILLNNIHYNTVWNTYKQLVSRTQLLETIWIHRHKVFKDLIKIIIFSRIYSTYNLSGNIIHRVWINRFLDNKESYLEGTNWCFLDYDSEANQYMIAGINLNLRFNITNLENNYFFSSIYSFSYVPDKEKEVQFSNKSTNIVYCEDESTEIVSKNTGDLIKLNVGNDTIKDIYNQVVALLETKGVYK